MHGFLPTALAPGTSPDLSLVSGNEFISQMSPGGWSLSWHGGPSPREDQDGKDSGQGPQAQGRGCSLLLPSRLGLSKHRRGCWACPGGVPCCPQRTAAPSQTLSSHIRTWGQRQVLPRVQWGPWVKTAAGPLRCHRKVRLGTEQEGKWSGSLLWGHPPAWRRVSCPAAPR